MYLTQDIYEDMGGAITDDAVFERLAAKADAIIDRMTHGRIKDETPVRKNVQYAAFELIEAMHADAAHDGREVASVSNDGVSVSYVSSSYTSPQRRYSGIVRNWLDAEEIDGLPILYAGVDA